MYKSAVGESSENCWYIIGEKGRLRQFEQVEPKEWLDQVLDDDR